MTKKIKTIIILIIGAVFLTGCAGQKQNTNKIKIGVVGTVEEKVWKYVKDEVAKSGIELEVVVASDYNTLNESLNNGDIQLNAFQHTAFLKQSVKKNGYQLAPIGTTFIAPLALYSNKVKTVADIKTGGVVTLPNDPTNQGRALYLLKAAGLIDLKDGVDFPTPEDITTNNKNLTFKPLDAATIPPTLQDVEVAVINNGIAVDAGLKLNKDAIFVEDSKSANVKPYINLIVAKESEKNNESYQKIVEVFQKDAKVAELLKEDQLIPAFVAISETGF